MFMISLAPWGDSYYNMLFTRKNCIMRLFDDFTQSVGMQTRVDHFIGLCFGQIVNTKGMFTNPIIIHTYW